MTRTYAVKELFLTLQGEGAHAGRVAVFCRFTGCNLWSGREADRANAVCRFCDTDFVGTDGERGGMYTARGLAAAAAGLWPGGGRPLVVCTGGEPLLQLDAALVQAFHARDFEVAVETNGTVAAPPELDWVCVSPKATTELAIRQGHELKFVYPQEHATPHDFADLAFDRFSIQPRADLPGATEAATAFCLANPMWRLSLQTHKLIGLR